MRLVFSKDFKKKYEKLGILRDRIDERLVAFARDPFGPFLHNHPLQGKWGGYRSININGDYRAIYREIQKGTAYFTALGTHEDLYR